MVCRLRIRCAGYLLLDSLVALSLFSFSLLGLASLHSRSLAVAHGAYLRSLAAVQAADLAERIRLNRDAGSGAYRLDCTATPVAQECSLAPGCAPDELAAHDIAQWCAGTKANLGAAFVAAVVSDDADGYLITLRWRERAIGTGGKQSPATATLSLRVHP